MNAKTAREAIENVCNTLAYYGIRDLNPEVFRQAKLNNPEVADRFWKAIFQLIVLHYNSFQLRLDEPTVDLSLIRYVTTYVIYKWGCPVPLSRDSSQLLLIAFGFTVDYVQLFSNYDRKFLTSPTPFCSLEELSSKAQTYLEENLPKPTQLTHSSILGVYKSLLFHLQETFHEITYCGRMISTVHELDPSLEPEDIWVAKSNNRIEEYKVTASAGQRLEKKRLEEIKHRTVFFKWLENILDGLEATPETEDEAQEEVQVDMQLVLESVEGMFQSVKGAWKSIQGLLPRIKTKWEEAGEVLQGSQVQKLAQELSSKFVTLTEVMESVVESKRVPCAIRISGQSEKDRIEGETLLFKRLPKLQQELDKLKRNYGTKIKKSLSSVPGIKAYNL